MKYAFSGDVAAVRLIETLLWDGRCYPRLAGHQARLETTAHHLGFFFDMAAWREALPHPSVAARVRASMGCAGDFRVQTEILPPSKPFWRVVVADERVHSGDPWLRFKTTKRALYDQKRAQLPDGVDEAIFFNERRELCEGTISNVFFDLGHGLCTPPLACGLLPGVLRAELLAQKQCREQILRHDDLAHARLWVGNALRGLCPAVLAG